MKMQCIASDFDWTIVYDRDKMNSDSKIALENYLAAGKLFVIVTGRPTFSLLPVLEKMGLTKYASLYVSCYNGATFTHPLTGETIPSSTLLDPKRIQDLLQFTKRHRVNLLCYHDEQVFSHPCFPFEDKKNSWDYLPIQIDDQLEKHLTVPLLKCIINSDETILKELMPMLQSSFPDLEFFFSQKFYIEVMPKGVHKGSAIHFIANHFQIPVDSILALGDSDNDVYMFQEVPISYAMANAKDHIKKAAAYTAEDVHTDALKQIILRHFPDLK